MGEYSRLYRRGRTTREMSSSVCGEVQLKNLAEIGSASSGSLEEIYPKAKLIDSHEQDGIAGGGNEECDNEQWGHFADFETIEEEDVVFLSSSRFQLDTLDEHEDEEE